MKATGIVRRIDDLGRVVIPKEIRRTMRIREGDPLEIYTDADGEVIFKISPEVSKRLKPGAFYNFAMVTNAFDLRAESEYKKLTDNGMIHIDYGAQDILVKPTTNGDIEAARLEPISDDIADTEPDSRASGKLVGFRIEEV